MVESVVDTESHIVCIIESWIVRYGESLCVSSSDKETHEGEQPTPKVLTTSPNVQMCSAILQVRRSGIGWG